RTAFGNTQKRPDNANSLILRVSGKCPQRTRSDTGNELASSHAFPKILARRMTKASKVERRRVALSTRRAKHLDRPTRSQRDVHPSQQKYFSFRNDEIMK